jgi:hypothetical protein
MGRMDGVGMAVGGAVAMANLAGVAVGVFRTTSVGTGETDAVGVAVGVPGAMDVGGTNAVGVVVGASAVGVAVGLMDSAGVVVGVGVGVDVGVDVGVGVGVDVGVRVSDIVGVAVGMESLVELGGEADALLRDCCAAAGGVPSIRRKRQNVIMTKNGITTHVAGAPCRGTCLSDEQL